MTDKSKAKEFLLFTRITAKNITPTRYIVLYYGTANERIALITKIDIDSNTITVLESNKKYNKRSR